MKAGIWLDSHKAYIVFLSNGNENMVRVNSEVEDFHVQGGAAAPSPYGTHDAISERRYLERKKHQLDRFYNDLVKKIKKSEAIYICGPAEAKIGLRKKIMSDSRLRTKLVKVEACDSLTENQIAAHIRTFYNEWLLEQAK